MRIATLPAAFLLAALACAGAAEAADAARGKTLYESGCTGCHAESVHGRLKREAKDLASLRAWVRRWSANTGLKWTDDEIADVAAHLNRRYYRFACPPADCKATGSREAPAPRLAALDAPNR